MVVRGIGRAGEVGQVVGIEIPEEVWLAGARHSKSGTGFVVV